MSKKQAVVKLVSLIKQLIRKGVFMMKNSKWRLLSLINKYADLMGIRAADAFANQTKKGSCSTYHQELENIVCDSKHDLRLTQTDNCGRSYLLSEMDQDPCTVSLGNEGDLIYDEIDSVCLIDIDFDDVMHNEDNCCKSPNLFRNILTLAVRKMFMVMRLFIENFQGTSWKLLSHLLPSRFVQAHNHFLNL